MSIKYYTGVCGNCMREGGPVRVLPSMAVLCDRCIINLNICAEWPVAAISAIIDESEPDRHDPSVTRINKATITGAKLEAVPEPEPAPYVKRYERWGPEQGVICLRCWGLVPEHRLRGHDVWHESLEKS